MTKQSTFIKLGKSPSEKEAEKAQVILHSHGTANVIPLRTVTSIHRLCFPETPFSIHLHVCKTWENRKALREFQENVDKWKEKQGVSSTNNYKLQS